MFLFFNIFLISLEYYNAGGKIIIECLENVLQNPFFGIREPGLSVRTLAQTILDSLHSGDDLANLANTWCTSLYTTFTGGNFMKRDKEILTKTFLNLCQSEEIKKLWRSTFNMVGDTQISNSLMNFVLNRFLFKSLQHFGKPREHQQAAEIINLSPSEQQTVRYVGGYVAFTLKKNLKTVTPEGKMIEKLINSWGNADDDSLNSELSLLEYTKTWVDVVNRGGLFQINDSFYVFIEKVEVVCRSLINLDLMTNYCGQDIQSVLLKKMESSNMLEDAWYALTRNSLSHHKLSESIRRKIYCKWINIRAHSFIQCWLQINKLKMMKQGKRHVEKSQPALRKTLSYSGVKSSPLKSSTQVMAQKRLSNAKKTFRKTKK